MEKGHWTMPGVNGISLQIGLISGLFMTGIIWYVQIVQYPLFASIDIESWVSYHHNYTKLAGFVIAPIMIVELIAGVIFAWFSSKSQKPLAIASIVCVAAIWLSTFLIQVPLHEELAIQWDAEVWKTLVSSNWVRTVLWTIKSLLLLNLSFR